MLFYFTALTAEYNASLLNTIKTDVTLTPPVGSESDDFMVLLGVTAEDRIGASTTAIFANITVRAWVDNP